MLRRIGQRLLQGQVEENINFTAQNWDWQYYIVDDPSTINACVLPGGKVSTVLPFVLGPIKFSLYVKLRSRGSSPTRARVTLASITTL